MWLFFLLANHDASIQTEKKGGGETRTEGTLCTTAPVAGTMGNWPLAQSDRTVVASEKSNHTQNTGQAALCPVLPFFFYLYSARPVRRSPRTPEEDRIPFQHPAAGILFFLLLPFSSFVFFLYIWDNASSLPTVRSDPCLRGILSLSLFFWGEGGILI